MPSEIDILSSYYADATKRLQRIILNPPGRTASSQAWRRADAAMRLKAIRDILAQLKLQVSRRLGGALQSQYMTGLRRAVAQLHAVESGVRLPGELLTGQFTMVDRQAIEILARDSAADLYQAANSMEKNAERVLRATADNGLSQAEINRVLAGGIIDGKKPEAIRELRDMLEKVHGGKLITIPTKGGGSMTFDSRRYAEMVVRTKSRQANTLGTCNRLQEAGLDLVIIQGRLSDNFCTAYVGTVWSISGNSDKYPPLSSLQGGGPPFHPNCSKSLSAWVDTAHDAKANNLVRPSEDVLSLVGQDPSKAQRMYKDLQLRQQATAQLHNVAKAMAS